MTEKKLSETSNDPESDKGRPRDKRQEGRAPLPLAPKRWGKYTSIVKFRDLLSPNWVVPVFRGISVHAVAGGLLLASAMALTSGHLLAGVACSALGAVILAPLYRGLESLVHGASHRDIHTKVMINDLVGNSLAGAPTFQSVGRFREKHLVEHHAHFAGTDDPCFERMNGHADTIRGLLPTIAGTLSGLPREIKGFYLTVGADPRTLVTGALWHAVFMIAPVAFATGNLAAALLAWLLLFGSMQLLTLPVIRSLAESGEHDYRRLDAPPNSMAERTFDNIGLINSVIHPFGDGWHIAHHLFPGVPQYRLVKLQRRLLAAGFGPEMNHRASLLGRPMPYHWPIPANDHHAFANDNSPPLKRRRS